MMIRRHETTFVLGPGGVPRRVEMNGVREPLRSGEGFFVSLTVAAGALRAKRLPSRSLNEAARRVGPGGRIGVPIMRRGRLGIVFQAVSIEHT